MNICQNRLCPTKFRYSINKPETTSESYVTVVCPANAMRHATVISQLFHRDFLTILVPICYHIVIQSSNGYHRV